MTVQIIKDLPYSGSGAQQTLVQKGDQYYVISSATFGGRFETMVFPSDANGNVTNYREVVGGYGMSQREAIDALNVYQEDNDQ